MSKVVPFPQAEGFVVPIHGSDMRVRIVLDPHLAAKLQKGTALPTVGRFELLDRRNEVVAKMSIEPAPMLGIILAVTGPETPEGLPFDALYKVDINHFTFQVDAESAVVLLDHGFALRPPDLDDEEHADEEDVVEEDDGSWSVDLPEAYLAVGTIVLTEGARIEEVEALWPGFRDVVGPGGFEVVHEYLRQILPVIARDRADLSEQAQDLLCRLPARPDPDEFAGSSQ